MHENIMCRSQLFLSLVLMYEVNADRLIAYPDSFRCTPRQGLCDNDGGHYHCLLDNKGRLGEWCLDKLQMIESMKCPYYNIHGGKGHLDARPCREMYINGCPQNAYYSNQSFNYSDCVQPEKSVVTTTQLQKQHTTSESPLIRNVTRQRDYHSTTTEDTVEVLFKLQTSRGEKENSDQRLNLILIIVVSVLGFSSLAAITVAVIVYIKRRTQQTSTPRDEEKAINRGSSSSDEFSGEKGKSFKDALLPNHH